MLSLHELGLVEKLIAMPAMFKAVPLQDAVSVLMANQTNAFTDMQAHAEELLDEFNANSAKTVAQMPEYWLVLIPAREVIAKTISEFNDSQVSIDCLASREKFLPLFSVHSALCIEALKRGVTIRIIVDKPTRENSLPEIVQTLEEFPYFNVRYVQSAPQTNMSIFDNKKLYINTSVEAGIGETPCYCTNNPSFLNALSDYFEIQWKNSKLQ